MTEILPAFNNEKNIIVFSADDGYAPYLGIAIKSIIDNSAQNHKYDIVVLDGAISERRKQQLSQLGEGKENISLRFFDIKTYVKKYERYFYICDSSYISEATYYRFFIPEIFSSWDKALYLDCDLVANEDIANLFATDLGNMWIGASCDAALKSPKTYFRDYIANDLKISNPDQYFNAGVILFNLSKIRHLDFAQQCLLQLKARKDLQYMDQDVLNLVCEGKIKFLDGKWNYQWSLLLDKPELAINVSPSIVHYTTSKKAWNYPQGALASHFWRYARGCPFYEEIIFNSLQKEFNQKLYLTINIKKQKRKYFLSKLAKCFCFGKLKKKLNQQKKAAKNTINAYRNLF